MSRVERDLVTLMQRPPPFVAGSDTSRAAANRIEPHLGPLQARVYACIADKGSIGRTDEEIALTLALNPSTARPRRIELADAGYIRKAPFTRETRSSRQAVVWLAA